LSPRALKAIRVAEAADTLCCADISLWEIAMLIDAGRLKVDVGVAVFIEATLTLRRVRVLPINPEIAALSNRLGLHKDPADRLIAATTIHRGARLVTSDEKLLHCDAVSTLW
jgi:PIN domain nuclease of toxin-antitoxin system